MVCCPDLVLCLEFSMLDICNFPVFFILHSHLIPKQLEKICNTQVGVNFSGIRLIDSSIRD